MLTYHAILSIIALLFDIFYESNKLLRPNYNGTSNEESIFRPLHLKEGLSWFDKGVNLLGIYKLLSKIKFLKFDIFENITILNGRTISHPFVGQPR